MENIIKNEENNMEKCPQFENYSVPLCPLDLQMLERVELIEDDQCPLRKLLVIGKHKRRIKINLSPGIKALLKFVPTDNR